MPALSAREAYRLWAPSYERETAVSLLEDRLVSRMTPPLAGRRLLDIGCGTGRRLRAAGAGVAVGVDPCPEMIAAGAAANRPVPGLRTLVGDARALPLPDRAFDVVWCRLVLGHLPELGQAYAEFARTADEGALVVVSDFHCRAYESGHRRTFRAEGDVHEIEHYPHPFLAHVEAGRAAGLTLVDWQEALVGPEIRHFYVSAGRATAYRDQLGLPLVLALAFEREA
jgi:malonyl-CoA O-methyltransferase